jgi:hypothetical protein
VPKKDAHFNKLMTNINLIQRYVSEAPEKPIPNDWLVTTYFYTALHVVEKKLADEKVHSRDHAQRFANIEEHYRDILETYQAMYIDSMTARYKCRNISSETVIEAKNNLYSICEEFNETRIINQLDIAHGVGVVKAMPTPVTPPSLDIDLSDAK